jgi:hypothetical protein
MRIGRRGGEILNKFPKEPMDVVVSSYGKTLIVTLSKHASSF